LAESCAHEFRPDLTLVGHSHCRNRWRVIAVQLLRTANFGSAMASNSALSAAIALAAVAQRR
jgi:hypothetical protein